MKSVKPLWQSVRVRDVPGGEKQTKRENSRQTNMFVNNRKEKILQDEQPKYSMNSKVVQDGTIPLPPSGRPEDPGSHPELEFCPLS